MIRIATPISHLFDDAIIADTLLQESDCLECRDGSLKMNYNEQRVFHCELQPIHRLEKKEFNYIRKIKKLKPDLKLISFHVATCYEKPIEAFRNSLEKYRVFIPDGALLSKEEMYVNANKNIEKIKRDVGPEIKIAIENNNYYDTGAYQHVANPEFINKIVKENNIYFLFDLAHAKITAHNKNIDYTKYFMKLPMDKAIQIHLSSHDIDEENTGYDAHNMVSEKDWDEIKNIIKQYPTIRYLTIEYYKDGEKLIKGLKKARNIINELY